MKHCPECNRNYADPTLNYCLNDGSPLIFGQAVEEPETAIIHETAPSSEAATRAQIHTTTDVEAEPQESLLDSSEKQSFSARRAAKPQENRA